MFYQENTFAYCINVGIGPKQFAGEAVLNYVNITLDLHELPTKTAPVRRYALNWTMQKQRDWRRAEGRGKSTAGI